MRKNHKRHCCKPKTDSGGCDGGVKILLADPSGERPKKLMMQFDFVENRIII